jgi:hypothetical protein
MSMFKEESSHKKRTLIWSNDSLRGQFFYHSISQSGHIAFLQVEEYHCVPFDELSKFNE